MFRFELQIFFAYYYACTIGRGDTFFFWWNFFAGKIMEIGRQPPVPNPSSFYFSGVWGPRNPSMKKWENLPINYPPFTSQSTGTRNEWVWLVWRDKGIINNNRFRSRKTFACLRLWKRNCNIGSHKIWETAGIKAKLRHEIWQTQSWGSLLKHSSRAPTDKCNQQHIL